MTTCEYRSHAWWLLGQMAPLNPTVKKREACRPRKYHKKMNTTNSMKGNWARQGGGVHYLSVKKYPGSVNITAIHRCCNIITSLSIYSNLVCECCRINGQERGAEI